MTLLAFTYAVPLRHSSSVATALRETSRHLNAGDVFCRDIPVGYALFAFPQHVVVCLVNRTRWIPLPHRCRVPYDVTERVDKH